jgi:aquaporin Z
MKKYVIEFIGTFFMVLTVVMTANNASIAHLAPLAVAGIYLAMVYVGGPISGGHFNPAVTIAMLISRKIDRGDALYYILVQLMAGVLAATFGVFLHDCGGGLLIQTRVNEQAMCAVLGEFLGTFALVFVFLNLSISNQKEGSSNLGIALGFTLLAVSIGLGGLSGGAFNPAIATGGSVAGMFAWEDIWTFFIGNLLGAAAAATAVQLMNGPEA